MGDTAAECMLASAEFYRQRNEIKKAVKFAKASSLLAESDGMKLLTVYQTGKLFYLHTLNFLDAEKYLEVAYNKMREMPPEAVQEYRLEAACMLAEIYVSSRNFNKIQTLAKAEWAEARSSPQLFTRLAFVCAEAAMVEGNAASAFHFLDQLSNFYASTSNDLVQRLYVAITKLLVSADVLNEIPDKDVAAIENALTHLPADHPSTFNLQREKKKKEYGYVFPVFFATVRLAHSLSAGQVRTGKTLLRSLQNMTQQKALPAGLRWADSSYITALTCLMTQQASMQHCSFDRAVKYHQYAVKHISEYSHKSSSRPLDAGVFHAMRRMSLVANEMMAQFNIVSCHFDSAATNITTMLEMSEQIPVLAIDARPRIHLLLGLLALYMEDEDSADRQFRVAAEMSEVCGLRDAQLPVIITLHRTLLYLTQCRQPEYYELADKIELNRTASCSPPVRAAVRFVRAFHAFLNNRPAECKQHVSDELSLTQAEDMFRLHTLAILLCSSLSSSFNNGASLMDTLRPTMEWSTRANDTATLMWTHSLIHGWLERSGNVAEAEQQKNRLGELANAIEEAKKSLLLHPARNLIKWTKENVADFLPRERTVAVYNNS